MKIVTLIKSIIKSPARSEKGAVMVEAAITFPFLLYIVFMGIELTRLSELQLARRDITRVLSLSHICAFRPSPTDSILPTGGIDEAALCFQEEINNVRRFTDNRFPGIQVYLRTYMLDNSDTRLGGSLNSCGGGLSAFRMIASSPLPSGFVTRNGPESVSEQFCLNGFITIVEYNLLRQPLFSIIFEGLGIRAGSDEARIHYEFGVV